MDITEQDKYALQCNMPDVLQMVPEGGSPGLGGQLTSLS